MTLHPRPASPGETTTVETDHPHGGPHLSLIHIFSRNAQPVELDLAAFKTRVPVELLGRSSFPPIGDLPYLLTLAGHGTYCFSLSTDVEVPYWHEERLTRPELPVLVPVSYTHLDVYKRQG